jgi:general stress protein 26
MDAAAPDHAPEHMRDLAAVERTAWDMMRRGALSRRHAFHQASLATVAADGSAAARTVVLREADRAARTLRIHTDVRSRKAAELAHEPRATLLLYDHGAKVQVRVAALATVHQGDDVCRAVWAGMREMAKACYRQREAPGSALADPAAPGEPLTDAEGYGIFMVVRLAVCGFEWLYLAASGHRRAAITYHPAPAATWLAP